MNDVFESTQLTGAYEMADRLPPPDDLLVRVLITQVQLLSLDRAGSVLSVPPKGFDSRPLVAIGVSAFERKDQLRELVSGGNEDELIESMRRLAGVHYTANSHVQFVELVATRFFSKPRLVLNILDGERDPFEGVF